MNFVTQPTRAGQLLKQVLSPGTARAGKKRGRAKASAEDLAMAQIRRQIVIRGPVEVLATPPARRVALIQHRSLPLAQILKRMNVYSNNAMANMITEALGGPYHVVRQAAAAAGIPANEIQLINGSGLGSENQLSPRAICAMFRAIHAILQADRLTVADVFPVAGYDTGTIRRRHLPLISIVKTGTLRNVSSLAGVILTRTHGPVWFALVNQGYDLHAFRANQDALLQRLVESWELADPPPMAFLPGNATMHLSRDDIVLRTRLGGG
jgi:D-alanyl-D-alanine carboxypeptidase/D-alanyl-D-alanine-endopeptidase (penicillin-binding protein 4)